MTVNGGPDIIEDGLVLYLDAANKRSYPGTGTTWTDLSRNVNGVLNGNLTFDANNNGTISFAGGSGDNATVTSTTLANISNTNHTIIVWVNALAVEERDLVGTGGVSTGDVLLMFNNGVIRAHAWSATGASNVLDSPTSVSTNKWVMVTQRVTWGGNIDIFQDNIKTATQAVSGGAPTTAKTTFYIGYRACCRSSFFAGKIANCMVYNRALSDAEITQNFRATRRRFGV